MADDDDSIHGIILDVLSTVLKDETDAEILASFENHKLSNDIKEEKE